MNVLSAMFHGVSLWNFHQGRNLWKRVEAKVWYFVADLRTKFRCVLIIFRLSSGKRQMIRGYELGRLPFPALAYLTEFSALILLLSVAAFPRPFGQIDHFDRSVLCPICLDHSLDSCIPMGPD